MLISAEMLIAWLFFFLRIIEKYCYDMKIAFSFVAIYDMGNKLEFNCQYKVQGMEFTPLCLDYW